jgi:hypothetical protein
MKSLAFILASVFCAGTPATAQPTEIASSAVVQSASNQFLIGRDVVKSIRAEYKAGTYTEFLSEMDRDYKHAKKANDLEGLIEIRKESASAKIHPEFAKYYRAIQDSKNKELIKLSETDMSSPFSSKLLSATQSIADMDSHLAALNFKAPGTGATSDENTLIDISLEYYYKAIHLDSASAKSSIADRKEKHMALEVEKMDKMLAASKSFTDKNLKQAVEDSAAILDARMARSYDMSDLLALSNGKIKPTNQMEEKAATVVSTSQGQLSELHRHLLKTLDTDIKN